MQFYLFWHIETFHFIAYLKDFKTKHLFYCFQIRLITLPMPDSNVSKSAQ